MSLPYTTHRRFLPHLFGTPSARDQISSRFLATQHKMEKSTDKRVSFIARICRDSARSIIGSNLRAIARQLNVHITDAQNEGRKRLRYVQAGLSLIYI